VVDSLLVYLQSYLSQETANEPSDHCGLRVKVPPVDTSLTTKIIELSRDKRPNIKPTLGMERRKCRSALKECHDFNSELTYREADSLMTYSILFLFNHGLLKFHWLIIR